ncbi:MAG: Ig-like domain-containing protein [Flavobacteriaceae bacterium]|nr:Ig-like domain-containing protein [Flavobacteriaceae bacterium]
MKKSSFLFLIVVAFTFFNCAKKGRPSGGPKDELAPLLVTTNPPYKTVNSDTNEIRIEFNEYITLKELNKQLVVSPPLKTPSLITPQGSPSKFITIKILDTLLPNTTYIFNFGNSIQDNNEGNKLERFKYVFSTGSYIDSLSLKGSVKNAFESTDVKDIKMLLYRLDTAFTDSIIYKRKPDYVTSTLDTSNYEFTNLKEGKYLLLALKEKTSDYIFNPKTDNIAFYQDTIVLPRDSVINEPLAIFKEVLPFSFKRAKELRKGQLIFGYEGDAKGMKVEVLSEVPKDFTTVSFFDRTKDSLNLWHSPIERDSLLFKITKGDFTDTVTVKLRKKQLDSLTISSSVRGILHYTDTLFFTSNNPILTVDSSKISFFTSKDTTDVPFTSFISKFDTRVGFIFEKKFKENYTFNLYPEALKDVFNLTNDSTKVKFRTVDIEDYGDITVSIQNPNAVPVIIELTDNKDKLERRQFVSNSQTIEFLYLQPKEYKIRIIYDNNNNGKWDSGNFLSRTQPEKVEYHLEIQEVRANWSLNASITIKE